MPGNYGSPTRQDSPLYIQVHKKEAGLPLLRLRSQAVFQRRIKRRSICAVKPVKFRTCSTSTWLHYPVRCDLAAYAPETRSSVQFLVCIVFSATWPGGRAPTLRWRPAWTVNKLQLWRNASGPPSRSQLPTENLGRHRSQSTADYFDPPPTQDLDN